MVKEKLNTSSRATTIIIEYVQLVVRVQCERSLCKEQFEIFQSSGEEKKNPSLLLTEI